MAGYIYDLAQLIHSSGSPRSRSSRTRSAATSPCATPGIYPETVAKLVAIEGLGPSPRRLAERAAKTIAERMDEWIREQRSLAGRLPRRYASIEDAFRRMQEENPHLSAEQARHLTVHGVNQNEDGTYSWKFDNYVRVFPPYDMRGDIELLWSRIACPTLLLYGKESWSGNPAEDGRAAPSITPASSASTAPATGSTTTASTSSSASSASSWASSLAPQGEGWGEGRSPRQPPHERGHRLADLVAASPPG